MSSSAPPPQSAPAAAAAASSSAPPHAPRPLPAAPFFFSADSRIRAGIFLAVSTRQGLPGYALRRVTALDESGVMLEEIAAGAAQRESAEPIDAADSERLAFPTPLTREQLATSKQVFSFRQLLEAASGGSSASDAWPLLLSTARLQQCWVAADQSGAGADTLAVRVSAGSQHSKRVPLTAQIRVDGKLHTIPTFFELKRVAAALPTSLDLHTADTDRELRASLLALSAAGALPPAPAAAPTVARLYDEDDLIHVGGILAVAPGFVAPQLWRVTQIDEDGVWMADLEISLESDDDVDFFAFSDESLRFPTALHSPHWPYWKGTVQLYTFSRLKQSADEQSMQASTVLEECTLVADPSAACEEGNIAVCFTRRDNQVQELPAVVQLDVGSGQLVTMPTCFALRDVTEKCIRASLRLQAEAAAIAARAQPAFASVSVAAMAAEAAAHTAAAASSAAAAAAAAAPTVSERTAAASTELRLAAAQRECAQLKRAATQHQLESARIKRNAQRAAAEFHSQLAAAEAARAELVAAAVRMEDTVAAADSHKRRAENDGAAAAKRVKLTDAALAARTAQLIAVKQELGHWASAADRAVTTGENAEARAAQLSEEKEALQQQSAAAQAAQAAQADLISTLQDARECSLCMDRSWNKVFLPCGHVSCAECEAAWERECAERPVAAAAAAGRPQPSCPCCREAIQSSAKIYAI